MLLILSPAKTFRKIVSINKSKSCRPRLLEQTQNLIGVMKTFSPSKLEQLMKISEKLAILNFQRFIEWDLKHDDSNSFPAILFFDGDVYRGFDAKTLTQKEIDTTKSKIRILSGLYGLLRPFDKIQPYRLEMGININQNEIKKISTYWREPLTNLLNKDCDNRSLINLASSEYSSSVNFESLKQRIIHPIFKERTTNGYKIIGIHAKRARGLMARFIIKNNLEEPEELRSFNLEGYSFSFSMSNETQYFFLRN